MKLWSGVLSNNAAKVRIVLREKAIPFEVLEMPWTKERLWEPKPEAFLKVSPRGQVPVLIDDGFIVYDSTVINEYLEDRFPAPALIPGDPLQKAQCRLWEDEGDFYQQYVGVLIRDVFLGEPGAPLTEDAEQAIVQLNGFFSRVAIQLDDRDYLCGEYSVADISVFMTAVFAVTLGVDIGDGQVKTWFERMLARPGVAEEYAAMMSAVAAL